MSVYRENTPPTPTLPRTGGGKSLASQSVEPGEDFHLRGLQNISVMSVYMRIDRHVGEEDIESAGM